MKNDGRLRDLEIRFKIIQKKMKRFEELLEKYLEKKQKLKEKN